MMLLSQAMRLGAISCKWGQYAVCANDGSRCAFGMAAFAIGEKSDSLINILNHWPWTRENVEFHRAITSTPRFNPFSHNSAVEGQIIKMNDDQLLTPLQIADWVEGLERERGMWDEESVEAKPAQLADKVEGMRI